MNLNLDYIEQLSIEYREMLERHKDDPQTLAQINLDYIQTMNQLLFGRVYPPS